MLSALAKFILGVSIAIILLVGGSFTVGYIFLTRLSSHPPKPIFAEEKLKVKSPVKDSKKPAVTNPKLASSKASPKLESGLYKARITWQEGVSLREKADVDSTRVGGIKYNENIVVLEETTDKNWIRVRSENSDQSGWTKSGNIEKINDNNQEKSKPEKQQ